MSWIQCSLWLAQSSLGRALQSIAVVETPVKSQNKMHTNVMNIFGFDEREKKLYECGLEPVTSDTLGKRSTELKHKICGSMHLFTG